MKKLTLTFTYLTLASAVLVGCMAATNQATAQQENGPNDLEIAHIAYTAGNIDIRYAHLALALSDDP